MLEVLTKTYIYDISLTQPKTDDEILLKKSIQKIANIYCDLKDGQLTTISYDFIWEIEELFDLDEKSKHYCTVILKFLDKCEIESFIVEWSH